MKTETIENLRSEAGEAGDLDMVDVCDRALAGNTFALAECLRVVTDALAQSTITTRIERTLADGATMTCSVSETATMDDPTRDHTADLPCDVYAGLEAGWCYVREGHAEVAVDGTLYTMSVE